MKKLFLLCIVHCALCINLMAQNKPTGVFMNLTSTASDMAQPNAISENGLWACGSAFWSGQENQVGTINASKWNLETGERTYLVFEDEVSDALCINNDGSIVGGSYLGQPAYWLESDGLWHNVEMPRGWRDAAGDITSMAFVDGDTIMVGYAYKGQTEGQIFRWVNGKIDTNFKYRNYTRYAEITGDTIVGQMQKFRGMSSDGERYLISLDHNLLPVAGSTNLPTTFVQKGSTDGYTTTVIEREFGNYDLVSFVEEATMSHNGKYVCGRIFGVPRTQDEVSTPAVPFCYNVDDNIFNHYGYIEETGRYAGASCVDNEGHVYFKSIDGNSPLGKPYINHKGQFIELESLLTQYEGITAEQIDAMVTDEVEASDEDDLGIVWCVSGDGKTLIGAGSALKGYIWVARLSCSPYDLVKDDETGVNTITFNNLAALYANGTITIEGNADMVEVYSITGAKVMCQEVENSTIEADLRNGIYVVKIYNGNDIATSKIIVK